MKWETGFIINQINVNRILDKIKLHCRRNITYDTYTQIYSEIQSLNGQINQFKNLYYKDGKLNEDNLKKDIIMIQGHSESSLITQFQISETESKKIEIDKINGIYVLFVSTNEICSACTNIIPEITTMVAEKLGITTQ